MRLLLPLLLVLAGSVQAQDYVGAYQLSGEDSLGRPVNGWIRLNGHGNVAQRVVEVGGETSRQSFQFVRKARGDSMVLESRRTANRTGLLALEQKPANPPKLTVVWTPGKIEVSFTQGDYTSRETGVRLTEQHNLQALRNDLPEFASVEFKGRFDGSKRSETLRYTRKGDATQEHRTYEDCSIDEEQLLTSPLEQTLTGSPGLWTPTRRSARATKLLKDSLLAQGSYRTLGITQFFPADPVDLGESWTLPIGMLADVLGLPEAPKVGRGSGRLVSVDEIGGETTYTVQVRFLTEPTVLGLEGPGRIRLNLLIMQSPSEHVVLSRLSLMGGDDYTTTIRSIVRTNFVVKSLQPR